MRGDPSRTERKGIEMERNEENMNPADGKRESGGCPRGCGGKGSNKLAVAIWVTLLLCVAGFLAYSQKKANDLLNQAYTLYAHGDIAASTDLLRQSARLGNRWAQLYYGERLRNGFGTDRDPAEAVKWLRKAAGKKCPEAYYQLGVCYENGEGVERNLDEAEAWYRKALESPDFASMAQTALDRIARQRASGPPAGY